MKPSRATPTLICNCSGSDTSLAHCCNLAGGPGILESPKPQMLKTGPEIQTLMKPEKQLSEIRPLGESQFGNVALHIPCFGFDKSENLQGEKNSLFPLTYNNSIALLAVAQTLLPQAERSKEKTAASLLLPLFCCIIVLWFSPFRTIITRRFPPPLWEWMHDSYPKILNANKTEGGTHQWCSKQIEDSCLIPVAWQHFPWILRII